SSPKDVDWEIPVMATEAQNGVGVPELLAEIRRHRAALKSAGALEARRRSRRRLELQSLLVEEVTAAVERRIRAGDFADLLERVAAGELDPYSALGAMLRRPDLLTSP